MEIAREFKFDTSHFLLNYHGKCSSMHGHTYRLLITLTGKTNPETNMLVDFGDLKKFFEEKIEPIFDHKTIVATGSSSSKIIEVEKEYHIYVDAFCKLVNAKRYVLPMTDVTLLNLPNTTVEELAAFIKSLTEKHFESKVKGRFDCKIKMWEGGAGSVEI